MVVGSGLSAQSQEVAEHPVLDAPHWQISANPFLPLALWFDGEIEYAPGESVGFGVALSYFDDLDDSESIVGTSLLVRYYPGRKRLRGFYMGTRLGLYSMEDAGYAYENSSRGDRTNSFGFGVELGHSWVFGPSGGFYIGLGGGLIRLFDDASGMDFLPIARIVNVGWAF